ncbi:adenylate/guanylate cyclase domain-containing protein [Larkinella rosea]|uniref:Adenylate/guanylate cyclase domain-containing protein n=2 Tax=Larkinella rosea TaxID=2025312 RepID=A0A3P1BM05_9BACT|nr:adenylate/guanylate cyclase domain-containing protein [Larkinella rosea]
MNSMDKKFEYTTLAQRYTARFPVLTYVGIQVNFWIIANCLLLTILTLHARLINHVVQIPVAAFGPSLLIAILFGGVWGVSLGLTGYYLDRKIARKRSLGNVILVKTGGMLILLCLIFWALQFILFDLSTTSHVNIAGVILKKETWGLVSVLLLVYYFFMTLIISFINQINKKYGPGVLLPLLLGRYRNPKEEERIFMFMDLKSSTSTAEQLGHIRYSSFIRDCFADINEVLFPFGAQVYQYVGDEIVIMWPEREGLKNYICIRFYFACTEQFRHRTGYYKSTYGFLPTFKAGMHTGKVTAVEIGEIKKDIAYHGDTLNTAARIQSVCNHYQKDFLVSGHLITKMDLDQRLKIESLGKILLRGKTEKVEIISVDWRDPEDLTNRRVEFK